MARKTKPEDLAGAVMAELGKYQQDVTDGIKRNCRQVAKECARDIREHSPELSGAYRKGWGTTVAYESRDNIRVVVHNRSNYRLTHLLEYGHQLSTGGRAAAIPHIHPAEERAQAALLKKVEITVKK